MTITLNAVMFEYYKVSIAILEISIYSVTTRLHGHAQDHAYIMYAITSLFNWFKETIRLSLH